MARPVALRTFRKALLSVVATSVLLLPPCSAAAEAGDGEDLLTQRLLVLQRRLYAEEERISRLEAGAAAAAAARGEEVQRRLKDDEVLPPSIHANRSGFRPYTTLESHEGTLTHMWLLLCGALAMFAQAGFAMLQAGYCRTMYRPLQEVFQMHMMQVCASTLGWWLFGWAFAFGGPYKESDGLATYKVNGFAGSEQFAGSGFLEALPDGQFEPSMAAVNWFFRWPFCSLTAVIATAGAAERMDFLGSLFFAFLFSSFVHPLVMAWTWGMGWLAEMRAPSYLDFAGSGVVHFVGGVGALLSALFAGQRKGRFEGQSWRQRAKGDHPHDFVPHSHELIAFGTFVLWFGWYGLICGSTMSMKGIEQGFQAAHAATNATLAAAVGGIVSFCLRFAIIRRCDLDSMCKGVLVGLVSISAGCTVVDTRWTLLIGAVGGLLFVAASALTRVARIDDPVDAFAVHGVGGFWGVIAAALLDWGEGFSKAHGMLGFRCYGWWATGTCADDNRGLALVLANLALLGAALAWTGGLSALLLWAMMRRGCLREAQLPLEEEVREEVVDFKDDLQPLASL